VDSLRETGRGLYFGLFLPMKKNQNRNRRKVRAFICCLYLWEQVRRQQLFPKILGKTQSNGRENIIVAQGNAGEASNLTRRECSVV